jgi:aminopeptidase N
MNDMPALSLNRRFAPVKVDYAYRVGELETLAAGDPDPFGRWDAWNTLAQKTLLKRIRGGNEDPAEKLTPVVASTLGDDSLPLDLKQAMLVLPSEEELTNDMEEVDPVVIHAVRQGAVTALADRFFQEFSALYGEYRSGNGEVLRDSESIAKRSLANTALGYLASQSGLAGAKQTVWVQFLYARGMTDKLAAFALLVHNRHRVAWSSVTAMALTDFYNDHAQYPNVIDKWFAVQATNPHKDALATVKQLTGHPAFDITVPNRVRALIGNFVFGNPTQFHDLSGDGYSFLADFVLKIDKMNPQVASRMVEPLISWQRYGKTRQKLMTDQLRRLSTEKLSQDVSDKVTRALASV